MNLAPQTYNRAPDAQLMPSAAAAVSLARGEPGAVWSVMASLGMRAALLVPVSVGLGGFAGVRPKAAIIMGIGGALAIEVAVLALAFRQESLRRSSAASSETPSSDVSQAQLPAPSAPVEEAPAFMAA